MTRVVGVNHLAGLDTSYILSADQDHLGWCEKKGLGLEDFDDLQV